MSIDINIYQLNRKIDLKNIIYDDVSHYNASVKAEFFSNKTFDNLMRDLFPDRVTKTEYMDVININKEDIQYIIDSIKCRIINIVKDKSYVNFNEVNDLSLAGMELYEWYLFNKHNDNVFENLIYAYEY